MSQSNEWCLVSSRGAILFYVALNPGCTVAGIADAMSLTRRSIWGIVGDLKRAGMITAKTVARRHHLTVNMGASFFHPTLPEFPLKVILGKLVRSSSTCQYPFPRTRACPRPGCSGSLISGVDGNTCLLCGRNPDATRPEVRYNVSGGLGREPRPGGRKRLRP